MPARTPRSETPPRSKPAVENERAPEPLGGRAFFPFQIRDVANAFAEIQDELRSQYAISYKPADLKADGHYRTIEIVASDRKNLRVRSRRGWYSPTQ